MYMYIETANVFPVECLSQTATCAAASLAIGTLPRNDSNLRGKRILSKRIHGLMNCLQDWDVDSE